MKKRRTITLAICLALVFAFAANTLAATDSFSFRGSCTKTFITSGTLSNGDSGTWSQFRVTPNELYYTGSPSYSYAYARPQGPDGTLYASKKTVSLGTTTYYTPNNSGAAASSVKVKFYNTNYELNNSSSCTLTIGGTISGTYA